jgi:hypothetical protein
MPIRLRPQVIEPRSFGRPAATNPSRASGPSRRAVRLVGIMVASPLHSSSVNPANMKRFARERAAAFPRRIISELPSGRCKRGASMMGT